MSGGKMGGRMMLNMANHMGEMDCYRMIMV